MAPRKPTPEPALAAPKAPATDAAAALDSSAAADTSAKPGGAQTAPGAAAPAAASLAAGVDLPRSGDEVLDLGGGFMGSRNEIGSRLARDAGLDPDAWDALPETVRRNLVDEIVAAGRAMGAAHASVLARLKSAAEAGGLEQLEIRSRDGKPFRRAGFQLSDAYQVVHVTPDQAEALRADPRGVQIKGEG